MTDPEMYLHEMGLSEYESAAYLALLQEGRATANDVATAADVPQSRVYDVLDRLNTKGFVKTQPGRPKKFGAVGPERAIDQYGEFKRDQFDDELAEAMTAGESFVDAVETDRLPEGDGDGPDIVWSYHSERQLFDVFERLCEEATDEIRMITRADSIERKVGRLKGVLEERSDAGVRQRVLVPESQTIKNPVVRRLGELAEVRRGDSIGAQIYLFDQEAILMAFPDGDHYVGLTIHNEQLSETLVHMFEAVWRNSA
jgi:sugar-specific transcriptional regulator TrmB